MTPPRITVAFPIAAYRLWRNIVTGTAVPLRRMHVAMTRGTIEVALFGANIYG